MIISKNLRRLFLIMCSPIPLCWWIFISIPTGIIRFINYQINELISEYKHYIDGF